MHEALERIAAGEHATGVADMLAALRGLERAAPGAGVDALAHFLGHYPGYRAALRALLRDLLGDDTAAAVHAGTGILANTGFVTEFGRRLAGKFLPPPRDNTLNGLFSAWFDAGDDVDWLPAVPAASWQGLLAAMHLDEDGTDAWQPARQALADALDMLSVRVAAIGVEPELQRHYRVPRAHNNPFLAQNAEMQRWLDGLREGAVPDTRQLEVLLSQCADTGERIRRAARRSGASFALTFALRRLGQMLARMQVLMALLDSRGGADAGAARIAYAVELVLAEAGAHGVREHLRDGANMVALQVTENAGRTGEHYITRTQREYLDMFRSALGAGGIIGVMAMIKTLTAALHLPPLVEALAYSLNYAAGFVLIYILHFTIATKQPAMTAQTIAAQISSGRRADVDAVALLVSRVSRTQFIAVLGNVLLAMPVALAVAWLAVAGGATAPSAKAPALLADLHPFASPALFHAAIAGVWL
ncbi:MAG: hypothetical protein ACOY3X_05215, partial [Pseudomonadota bacterium]